MEKKTGVHSIFSFPPIYNLFQNLVGAIKSRRYFTNNFVKPCTGDRIIDIGCGTGEMFSFLGKVDYHGFDQDPQYIGKAKNKFPDGSFFCSEINRETLKGLQPFDIALAVGVLHHLSDDQAADLFNIAYFSLRAGGRLLTVDPCFDERQSFLARWIIGQDRGKNIRSASDYSGLASSVFRKVKPFVRLRPLRIPYTHIILECEK